MHLAEIEMLQFIWAEIFHYLIEYIAGARQSHTVYWVLFSCVFYICISI